MFTDTRLVLAYFLDIRSNNATYYLYIGIFAIYLASRANYLRVLFRNKCIFLWLVVVMVLPLLLSTVHYAFSYYPSPYALMEYAGQIVVTSTLFVTCACLSFERGTNNETLYIWLLLILFVGVAASFYLPTFLATIHGVYYPEKIKEDASHLYRISGFSVNPNYLASQLVVALICVFFSKLRARYRLVLPLVYVFAVVCILLTGSRTSFLVMSVVFAVMIAGVFTSKHRLTRRKIARYVTVAGVLMVLIVGVVIAVTSLMGKNDSISKTIDRFVELPATLLTVGQAEGGSLGTRFGQLNTYISKISEEPVLGHSPYVTQVMVNTGLVNHSSQNSWIDWALGFGIPYALLVGVMLIYFYKYSRQRPVRHLDEAKLFRALLLAFLITTFSVDNLLWNKPFVIAIGFALGALIRQRVVRSSREMQHD